MRGEWKHSSETTLQLHVPPLYSPPSIHPSSPFHQGYLSQRQTPSGKPPFMNLVMAYHFLQDKAQTPYSGSQTTS